MIPISLSALAEATQGELFGDPHLQVTGAVVTDSRACELGGLYVARIGEHADGHDFIPAARSVGVTAVLAQRRVDELPTIVVADPQLAFGQLAAAVRRSGNADVVAVTGSSGKTSVKDLLAQVLGQVGPTVAPENSLNSEIGMPLTICRMGTDTRFLVLEMGARGAGQVQYLAQLAQPRVGVVLNVGNAHIGEFGSMAAIAEAKSELPACLPPARAGGVAILNADDAAVSAMASLTTAQVVTFGEATGATWRAIDITLAQGYPTFTAVGPGERGTLTLPLLGRHQVGNALAAIAAASSLGVPLETTISALEQARPVSRWRMDVIQLAQEVTLINDAYNANPDSMRAALAAADAMRGERRLVAVLGSMLELGEGSTQAHQQVGAWCGQHQVQELIVVGEAARSMCTAAQHHGVAQVEWVPDADAAYDHLRARLQAGDVVLVKSSRDTGLRLLGDRLAAEMEVPS